MEDRRSKTAVNGGSDLHRVSKKNQYKNFYFYLFLVFLKNRAHAFPKTKVKGRKIKIRLQSNIVNVPLITLNHTLMELTITHVSNAHLLLIERIKKIQFF